MSLQATLTATMRPPELAQQTALQRSLHRSLWTNRERMIGSLWRCFDPTARRWAVRLNACATTARVMIDPDKGKVRPWLDLCRSRLCSFCGRARAKRLELQVTALISAMKAPKHLTLTYRSSAEPLADQVRALKRAFARMRRSPDWKSRVTGGVYSLEVTRNPTTGWWHPHLHVIIDGTYFPWQILRRLWSAVMPGGENIWIRPLDDAPGAARHMSKYVSKPPSIRDWPDPAIVKYAFGIQHQRMIQTFGRTYGRKVEDKPAPPEDSPKTYAISIPRVVNLAARGVDVARNLSIMIRRRWPVFDRFITHQVPDLPDRTSTEQRRSPFDLAVHAHDPSAAARAPPAEDVEKIDAALFLDFQLFKRFDEAGQLPDSNPPLAMSEVADRADFR